MPSDTLGYLDAVHPGTQLGDRRAQSVPHDALTTQYTPALAGGRRGMSIVPLLGGAGGTPPFPAWQNPRTTPQPANHPRQQTHPPPEGAARQRDPRGPSPAPHHHQQTRPPPSPPRARATFELPPPLPHRLHPPPHRIRPHPPPTPQTRRRPLRHRGRQHHRTRRGVGRVSCNGTRS